MNSIQETQEVQKTQKAQEAQEAQKVQGVQEVQVHLMDNCELLQAQPPASVALINTDCPHGLLDWIPFAVNALCEGGYLVLRLELRRSWFIFWHRVLKPYHLHGFTFIRTRNPLIQHPDNSRFNYDEYDALAVFVKMSRKQLGCHSLFGSMAIESDVLTADNRICLSERSYTVMYRVLQFLKLPHTASVVDLCAGSASLGVACILYGITNYHGSEIESNMCKMANLRLQHFINNRLKPKE